MVAAPTVAIDLPLKVLAWEDAQGKTWVAVRDSPRAGMNQTQISQQRFAAGVAAKKKHKAAIQINGR